MTITEIWRCEQCGKEERSAEGGDWHTVKWNWRMKMDWEKAEWHLCSWNCLVAWVMATEADRREKAERRAVYQAEQEAKKAAQ